MYLLTRSLLLQACTFLCCLLLNFFVHAQDEVDTSFNNRMNYVFGQLEKNRVPYGLLRDYAFEFTNLNVFNGAGLVDSNHVDYTTLGDIYNTLITSRIHANASGLVSPAIWDSLWYTQRQNGIVTLSGLFFNYARFRDDAVSSGRLTISNQKFVDRYVNGAWQNPYQSEQVFAIAPSVDMYQGKNFQVKLPSNLWFTNSATTVSNINIDLSDGQGYRTLMPGQLLSVSYADTGRKEWKFRLSLTNGAYLYAHTSVLIKPNPFNPNEPSGGISILTHNGEPLDEGIPFTATRTHLGKAAQGFVTIHYANPDRVIRQPLIVAEGFDVGHITNPEQWWGSQGIGEFFDYINFSGSNNLINLLTEPSPEYDIIYVDWAVGTDFIQRNALLLEDIIQWVNDQKQPLDGVMQPNVIIGQSMGGLVTRWALRDMENRGQDHQTRLFISYDSPHQGANAPLGYQYMYRHAKSLYLRSGFFPNVDAVQIIRNRVSPFRALHISNTPAARQMLINWVNDNYQIDNSMHDQWQVELRNMGYPQQLVNGIPIRNVAVSNGSECAVTQPFAPGATLLNYSGRANTRILSDLIMSFSSLGHNASLWTSSATGHPAFLMGFIPGKNEIKFEFSVNAQPQQSTNRLYRGFISYKKTWLWTIPVQVTITDRSHFANTATLPFDYYPGGQINTGIDLQSSNSVNFFTKYSITASHIPTFSFIPTTSALDIGGGNTTLTHADYLTRYVGAMPPATPKNTPFQNFITAFNNTVPPINNEEHIDILARNGNWVANELNRTPALSNCTVICSNNNVTIGGPSVLCSNSGTYILNNPPTGVGISWAAFPTGIVNVTTSPDGLQATLTKSSTQTGSVTLAVTFTATGCGSQTYTKSIEVISGPEIESITIANPSAGVYGSACYTHAGNQVSITTRNPVNHSNFVVTLTNLQNNTATTFNTGSTFTVPVYQAGWYTLQAQAISDCGLSDPFGYFFQAVDCTGSIFGQQSAPAYTVSPNPASTDITVATNTSANAKEDKWITEVSIYDQQGTLKKQQKFAKVKKARLNISNLPFGIYFIEVSDGKTKERQVLSIQK